MADTTRKQDKPLEVTVEKINFKTKCQLMQEESENGNIYISYTYITEAKAIGSCNINITVLKRTVIRLQIYIDTFLITYQTTKILFYNFIFSSKSIAIN